MVQHYAIFSSGRIFNNHKQFTERSWTLLTKFLRPFLLPHSCLTSSLPHCKKALDISDPVFITVEILFEKLAMNLVTYTQYQPTPFLLGVTAFSPKFSKRGIRKKMSAWNGLKSSCHGYLPGGVYYVSCQNKTFKNKTWLWGLNFKCWSCLF